MPRPRPPVATKKTVTSIWHGVELRDDYAWLRAENWQEVMRHPSTLPAAIRRHLEAENAYTKAIMADTEPLQETLFAEMKGRIKEDDSTVPSPDGPWAYYTSFITGGQYPLHCRKPRGGGDQSVLLDGNREAKGHVYWEIAGARHSPDHRWLAYSTDTNGSEYYSLRVRDLETGRDLADEIPNTSGGVAWAKDSRTFYYLRLDDNHRPLFVYRHALGTSVASDELVYREADTGFYVHVGQTQSGDFILIEVSDHETSEVHLLDANDPKATPRLVAPRRERHEYSVEHHGDTLYVLTNSGGAEDFRVCTVGLDDPVEDNWQELIPHRPGTFVLSLLLLKGYMVRLERARSLPRIVNRRLADGAEHQIAFEESAYSLGLSAGYEFDTQTIRFTYSSMTTPTQVYDYDLETRERTLRKTQQVPSGHDPANYETERLFANARDGVEVPITLLYHRTTALDGSAPLVLYGYGSYGMSMPASFSTARLSLVDRGFVYAIAHVRGGKEMGYRWYIDGKRDKKINTFSDFIDCGAYLVEQGFTTRGRIVASGGSAGGLLMGAVANMAPDLFVGVIADVPFVDVLNTILDKDLPLTAMEWPEWGNPILSPDDFNIIHAYSPYDNVTSQAYPHLLALAGLTDPRVTYWEPAKWIAKLRELSTSDNLVLLKTNMDAGHGGASGRFDALRETALEYAFALKIVG